MNHFLLLVGLCLIINAAQAEPSPIYAPTNTQYPTVSDSATPKPIPYILKRKGLYHGETFIPIGKGLRFGYTPEFKRQFDQNPVARREMLKSQTYHYVMTGGLIVNAVFAGVGLYDAIRRAKNAKEGKGIGNPRPAHDVVNIISIGFVMYYGGLKAKKHRKRAVQILNGY